MKFSLLQRVREYLTLALIALLPFHAFFVTVGTKWIVGVPAAPLSSLAIWKELLLVDLFVIVVIEILLQAKKNGLKSLFRFDIFDALIFALILLSLAVAYAQGSFGSSSFVYGFRYDFIPLITFLICRRVNWSAGFFAEAKAILVLIGGIVSAYGIIGFFLPQSFFTALGYSDLHSLYLPDQPIAAFQQIGGGALRRIQSTMSGPNQLGLWLLLPWSIMLVSQREEYAAKIRRIIYLSLVSVAIVLTFSRSAWIAAAVILVMWLWVILPRSIFKKRILQCAVVAVVILAADVFVGPNVFLRAASSRDHILRPIEAIKKIAEEPFGHGLGTAGPANNRVSDACVHLEEGADASWAADRRDLCVFVGETKVQPMDKECNCPFLPENWYLQIGVELGILGLALFLVLVIFLLEKMFTTKKFPEWIFFSFLGISIASLFLHAWEDAAVSYTLWIMIPVAVGASQSYSARPATSSSQDRT